MLHSKPGKATYAYAKQLPLCSHGILFFPEEGIADSSVGAQASRLGMLLQGQYVAVVQQLIIEGTLPLPAALERLCSALTGEGSCKQAMQWLQALTGASSNSTLGTGKPASIVLSSFRLFACMFGVCILTICIANDYTAAAA